MHNYQIKNGLVPPMAGLGECTPEALYKYRALGFLNISKIRDFFK